MCLCVRTHTCAHAFWSFCVYVRMRACVNVRVWVWVAMDGK